MFKKLLFTLLFSVSLAPAAVQRVEIAPQHDCSQTATIGTSTQAPRHIILMIGDGMGMQHLRAAWLANGGQLHINQLPIRGASQTYSASHAITDSAAGGSALACGQKCANGHLGQDAQGQSIPSLADAARERGMSCALVSSKDITDATPAAFYAHEESRKHKEAIAKQLCQKDFALLAGGGSSHFSAEECQAMEARGCSLHLAAEGDCQPVPERGAFLEEMTQEALQRMEGDPVGFFLMVEGAQIDMAAHANDLPRCINETLDFDRCVGLVLRWMQAHPDSLLVVTADHSTGGLYLKEKENGEPAPCVIGEFNSKQHGGDNVGIFAAGCGAENFAGLMENTEIQHRLLRLLPKPQEN